MLPEEAGALSEAYANASSVSIDVQHEKEQLNKLIGDHELVIRLLIIDHSFKEIFLHFAWLHVNEPIELFQLFRTPWPESFSGHCKFKKSS